MPAFSQARRIAWTTLGLPAVFFGTTVRAAQIEQLEDPLGRGTIPVWVPDSYDPMRVTPLVLLLHGSGATGAFYEATWRFSTRVDDLGFLYLTPNAPAPFRNGFQWSRDFAASSSYLRELIQIMKARYSVDPTRVFLVGHSNGSRMCYRMVCEDGDTIAGVASISGHTLFDPVSGQVIGSPTECAAPPGHILHIHGSEDPVNAYCDGGESVRQWSAGYACSVEPEGAEPGCGARRCDVSLGQLDLIRGPEPDTVITRYTDCNLGGSVELWTIQGGDHLIAGVAGDITPMSQDYTRLVIEWLFDHPKVDCNGNGVPDEQDIADALSADCDGNGFPDECDPDCNGNGVPDDCEIADGTVSDCDGNGVPDECDRDCNGNGVPDSCETLRDINANGAADACEPHLFGDLDLDGDIDLADFISMTQCFSGPGAEPDGPDCCRRPPPRRGSPPGPCNSPADLDDDGDVDLTDMVIFQASFTGAR